MMRTVPIVQGSAGEAAPLYPHHEKDGGALLPTTDGGVICAICHDVNNGPSASVLIRSRAAHKAAGEKPLALGRRPAPEALRLIDLTPEERKTLCRAVATGRERGLAESGSTDPIDSLREAHVTPLVALGLVTVTRFRNIGVFIRELTKDGERLARLCAEAEAAESVTTELLFDLGAPDPAAVSRLAREGRLPRDSKSRK